MGKKKTSLPKRATVDPLHIFLQALFFDCSYHLLASKAESHLNSMPASKRKVIPVSGSVVTSVIDEIANVPPTWIPSLVSGFFSVELYLKSVVAKEKNGVLPKKIHDLSELFATISPAGRKRIEELFAQALAKNSVSRASKARSANPSDWELVPLLTHHDQAFSAIRYSYELLPGWSFDTLVPIREALFNYSIEQSPAWEAEVLKTRT